MKSRTFCGADCKKCPLSVVCKGCMKTGGRPFGGTCMISKCCKETGVSSCKDCPERCELRNQLMEEINELHIGGMPPVTELFALAGTFVNLEYPQEDGTTKTYLDSKKVYLGTQMRIEGSTRVYAVAADEDQILVCTYEEGGKNPQLISLTQRADDEEDTE